MLNYADYVQIPLLLILPLAIAGILHMLVVKWNLCKGLAVPLSRRVFGKSKTYRGFVIMPGACMLGVFVTQSLFASGYLILEPSENIFQFQNYFVLGGLLGLAYVLGELPNSFLKRRLGIMEGHLPTERRWLFFLIDHCDSAVCCLIVYYVLLPVTPMALLFTIFWSILIHTLTNYILYLGGVRQRPH